MALKLFSFQCYMTQTLFECCMGEENILIWNKFGYCQISMSRQILINDIYSAIIPLLPGT